MAANERDRISSPPPPNGTSAMPPPDAHANSQPHATFTRHDSRGAASTGYERPSSAGTGLRRQPSFPRRRSSMVSDFSQSMHDSTESLLLPRANLRGKREESSHWHSVPLAFAILPAVGGLFFDNGSAFITDVFLLGLGGLFLNWFVRMPWDWYYSAQAVTVVKPESNFPDTIIEESEEDEAVIVSEGETADSSSKDKPDTKPRESQYDKEKRDAAVSELQVHENFALLACFLGPILGAYLLHAIRSQLTRPSEGLVSNFNLTIFVLAAELRPCSHLISLVQARTLHLQRVIQANTSDIDRVQSEQISELQKRVEETEARVANTLTTAESKTAKDGAASEVQAIRLSLQPQLDALNRAVRRYEKRSTTQSMQTEARLQDLEARLRDALSLAAVAAERSQQPGVIVAALEWLSSLFMLPLQALWSLFVWPVEAVGRALAQSKTWVFGGRLQSRPKAKQKKAREKDGVDCRINGQKMPSKGTRRQ